MKKSIQFQLITCMLLAAICCAGASFAAESAAVRRAMAVQSAAEAVRERDAEKLIIAVRNLLATGATPDDDDPWDVPSLIKELHVLNNENGGRYSRDIALLLANSRGSVGGFSRYDLDLGVGAVQTFDITLVQDEAAIVEVLLKKGSEGADVDLTLSDADGIEIARDVGPTSGVLGSGAYVEFKPERCVDVVATLENVGGTVARVAVLIPQALERACAR